MGILKFALGLALTWSLSAQAKQEKCEVYLLSEPEKGRVDEAIALAASVDEKLALFEIARNFGVESAQGQFQLVQSVLENGKLWKSNSDFGIDLLVYDSLGNQLPFSDLAKMVRAWPQELRERFALDFVESARPQKEVFMANINALFNVIDSNVIREVNSGVLKTFLKRWGNGKRFEDLEGVFLASGMSKDRWDLVRWSLDYPLTNKHVPYAEFVSSVHAFAKGNLLDLRPFLEDKAIKRKLLSQYGAKVIVDSLRVDGFYDLPLRAAAERPNETTLIGVVEDFMKVYPGVIPPWLISALELGTGDRDTFIYLLNTSFKELDKIDANPNVDFFELLTLAFPWPREQMERWSKQGRRDVLALAAEIYDITEKDLFEYLKLDSTDFPPADDLSDLMELIRNSYQLDATPEKLKVTKRNPKPKAEILQAVVKELVSSEEGEKIKVSAANIKALVEAGRDKFTGRIRATLNAEGGSVEFTYEDLMKLTEEWSDIEPIMTLFARLSDARSRAIVLEVFKQSLNDSFGSFKFYHPDASPQVGFLNEQQMKAWTRSRVRIATPPKEAAAEESPANSAKEVDHLVNDELMPALQASNIWTAVTNAGLDMAVVNELAAASMKANPVEVINQFAASSSDAQVIGRLASSLFKQLGDRKSSLVEKRNASRLFLALINTKLREEVGEQKEALSTALKNIERAIPKTTVSPLESTGFVVSVVDHSPRLLLTVGDLVQCNSCQNYKTGGMIYTLPGYVIDGNVQVMASFHVESKHFHNIQDFRAVVEALDNGTLRDARFNGNRRTLTFTLGDQTKIESDYLGYAFLRQMLKLGSVQGRGATPYPSLRLEKEYMQNNTLMTEMQKNHKKLLKDLVTEMNAVQDQTMKIPQSRNPLGVYSDLATSAGVKKEAYEFAPQPGNE